MNDVTRFATPKNGTSTPVESQASHPCSRQKIGTRYAAAHGDEGCSDHPLPDFINAQSAYLPFACRHGHGRSACPGRHEFGIQLLTVPSPRSEARVTGVLRLSLPPRLDDGQAKTIIIIQYHLPNAASTSKAASNGGLFCFCELFLGLVALLPAEISGSLIRHSPTRGFRPRHPARQPRLTQRRRPCCR